MRRALPSLLATATLVALIAAPNGRAVAQANPTSDCLISGTGATDPKTGATYTTPISSKCSTGGVVSIPPADGGGSYIASSGAAANPGLNVGSRASYNGDAPIGDSEVSAFAKYYRYFTFGGPDAGLVKTIRFTAKMTIDNLDPGDFFAIHQNLGELQWGFLNLDNTAGAMEDNATNGETATFSGEKNIVLNVDTDDLGGETSFWFSVYGGVEVHVGTADPIGHAQNNVLEPTIEFFNDAGAPLTGVTVSYDPPTIGAVPEPSSIVLMATGIIGIAGFARRKRRGS